MLRRATPAEMGLNGEVRGIPPVIEAEFGIYRTPVEFIASAEKLLHPFDAADLVSDASFRAVFATLTRGVEAIVASQREVIERWRRWAVELQPKEDELHAKMPERVASVYKDTILTPAAHPRECTLRVPKPSQGPDTWM